jgi:hypothetical protein
MADDLPNFSDPSSFFGASQLLAGPILLKADAGRDTRPMANLVPLDISDHVLDQILTKLRSRVSGPDRVTVVVVFTGAVPMEVYVQAGQPPLLGGDEPFSRDVQRVWNNYEIGSVVPLVMVRIQPPFTGLKIYALPWADLNKKWCSLCGIGLCKGACGHKCAL